MTPSDSTADTLDQLRRLGAAGRFAEVLAGCEKLLQHAPNLAGAWLLLGRAALELQRFGQANTALKRAHELAPNAQLATETAADLGVLACRQKDYAEGVRWLERALPASSNAVRHNLLRARRLWAGELAAQGQSAAAAEQYGRLLAQHPGSADDWLGLALARRALDDRAGAEAAYQEVLSRDPQRLEALVNLGRLYQQQRRLGLARRLYEQAHAAHPGNLIAALNLAHLRWQMDDPEAALELFQALFAQHPDSLSVLDGLLSLKLESCDWDGLPTLLGRLRTHLADPRADLTQIAPYNTVFLPLTAAEQLQVARAHARKAQAQVAHLLPLPLSRPAPAARLRVGYFSADFREHILGEMIVQLFELHDRTRFEIWAYACDAPDESAVAQQLRHGADHFCDLSQMPPEAAARRIAADGIDVLVYLGGYTDGDRPEILALRPAPVQMAWLDYPATLGADYIDYLVGDAWVTPEHLAPAFSETIIRLPHSYQLNNTRLPRASGQLRRSDCGLPETGVVFACLNKPSRLDPVFFEAWLDILAGVPGSVLWLLSGHTAQAERLRKRAADGGIAPTRLVFAPPVKRAAHLERQSCMDLFLDTQHTNAHTTASDALWSGVPVLTLPGQTFSSRVGASLLAAVGLPELIMPDLPRYVETAIALGRTPERLRAYHAYLRAQAPAQPLFDSPRTVRGLETLYEQLRQHQGGGAGS
ncbi:MAG: tetratricopeptide repeat protein [Candidatus Sericytochromatia bacterium]